MARAREKGVKFNPIRRFGALRYVAPELRISGAIMGKFIFPDLLLFRREYLLNGTPGFVLIKHGISRF